MRQLPLPGRQRGAVLLVALVMLIMMLLMAISGFNMGRQNTIIAGNMQHRAEVLSAANQTVETVISKSDFITNPSVAIAASGTVPANQANYDVNGDGTADIMVTLSPTPCIKKSQPIKDAELDINPLTNPAGWKEDLGCSKGKGQNLGVDGASNGDSLCSHSIWEVNAVAVDNVTAAATTVTTGIGVRVASDTAINPAVICP